MISAGTIKCPFCSHQPTSSSDYCDKHKPKFMDPPAKCCQNCGHPKAWHDKRCWGNPVQKGICGAMCQKFKGAKK